MILRQSPVSLLTVYIICEENLPHFCISAQQKTVFSCIVFLYSCRQPQIHNLRVLCPPLRQQYLITEGLLVPQVQLTAAGLPSRMKKFRISQNLQKITKNEYIKQLNVVQHCHMDCNLFPSFDNVLDNCNASYIIFLRMERFRTFYF